MNDRDGVRVGRPYGGLGILWRKSLGQSCTVKPLGDPRLLMLEISLDDNRHMTLLNVYLPCDDGSNLEDYQMYLAKVSTYLDGIYSAALGDFNGNTISRKHRFGNQLVQFCESESLVLSDSIIGIKTCILTTVNHMILRHGWITWLVHITSTHWLNMYGLTIPW